MLDDIAGLEVTDEDLATSSTWWPGFSHSVIVPTVDQAFCNRCHGMGTALLDATDLQYPEYESQQMVGKLPAVVAADYLDE